MFSSRYMVLVNCCCCLLLLRSQMLLPVCRSPCESSAARFTSLLLLFIVYLLMGATIFSNIEGPVEQERIEDLRRQRAQFLRDHSCVSGKQSHREKNSRKITINHWKIYFQ